MDNFVTIYKILKVLEKAMDFDELDMDLISAKALGISENRRLALLKMLADNGYLEGVHIRETCDGMLLVAMPHPRITLKGLEYLEENSMMKRAYRLAKGIKDVIPGI